MVHFRGQEQSLFSTIVQTNLIVLTITLDPVQMPQYKYLKPPRRSKGVVFKCINRQTGQIVAIKRYSENDSDPIIRKIAMREVRMLRQLKHPNLIQLIEVFRRRRILHLVFDYCELTVLDVIEKYTNNCPLNLIRKIIWQLVNGVSHCHSHNVSVLSVDWAFQACERSRWCESRATMRSG